VESRKIFSVNFLTKFIEIQRIMIEGLAIKRFNVENLKNVRKMLCDEISIKY